MSLNPENQADREENMKNQIKSYNRIFESLDTIAIYQPLLGLLWYSIMPCFDVEGITSSVRDEMSTIKRCYWKNRPISCAAIFQKHPTDRGMCCAFNMKKAEEIFKRSIYTEFISDRQKEEAEHAFEDRTVPLWYKQNNEPTSEAGESRGLKLILDRHSDRLSTMSVTDDFKGFIGIVDGKDKYPMAYLNDLRINPGMENDIKVNAITMESDQQIREYSPERRKI